MATTITMPSLGESVAEGEVGKWLVTEGQRVAKDDPLVEIMTDKADSEIPATSDGVITKIFVTEGDMVAVGDALCEIDANAEASAGGASKADAPPATKSTKSTTATTAVEAPATAVDAPTSPAVRKLAREKGIDLSSVRGTGEGGRITRDDVLASATKGENGGASTSHEAVPPPPPEKSAQKSKQQRPAPGPSGAFRMPPYVPTEGDEVVPFSRRRRIIADHMVYSKLTAPHVVTFAECDLHASTKLRAGHKGEFEKAGLNLTYLSFVCAATCKALQEFRALNARVLDDAYVLLREINLGIAVDTPEGLVVPVIRSADELSIRGIARAIDELAEKARDGKLAPDDLAGKSFTISNPGRRGNLVGGAIISQPNVGILRIGEIKKRVVVVEKDGEDLMAIHPVMQMALSYDHRIVDGVHANGFLWRINEILETADFEV
jgi:2-oxoglutarate dehydrogenase E2 component (dihydrolipoamide succinyltransferase)